MNTLTVDYGLGRRALVEAVLPRPPVISVEPVIDETPYIGDRNSVVGAGSDQLMAPTRPLETAAQVVEIALWYFDARRTNGLIGDGDAGCHGTLVAARRLGDSRRFSPNIGQGGTLAIANSRAFGITTWAGPVTTTLHLPLDRDVDVPLFRQIYDGLRGAILEGRLRPGQRIPSTRSLASDLGVSRLPVLSAYDQLLHEGYLVGKTGSGTFVTAHIPDHLLRSRAIGRLKPPAQSAGAVRARAVLNQTTPTRWSLPAVPFQIGLPALDLFPHAAWAKVVTRQVRAETPEQLAYGDPAGLRRLRVAIAEHLRTSRAVRCVADQILIVPGSQAALRLAAATLLGPNDRVPPSQPGYFGAHRAFRSAGLQLVPVPVDAEGLNVAALQRRGASIRAVT